MTENIAEVMDEFKREVMPKAIAAIKAIKTEYPEDWQRERRIEYLKTRMEEIVYRTLIVMHNYDVAVHRGDSMDTRLFLGGQIVGGVKTISKLQTEVYYLKKPGATNGQITDDMIARAKDYPIENLLPEEVKRGRCRCPVHNGDNTMSFSVKNNRGKCFSCGWEGDTIKYVMDTQGLTFPDAVKRLQ